MRRRGLAFVFALVACLSLLPGQAAADELPRYFPETGFTVADSERGRFLSEFDRYGGVATLGYPVSYPYQGPGGLRYQLFQRGALQWWPDRNRAEFGNLMDWLTAAGQDPILSAKSIPAPLTDSSGGDFARAVAERESWLTDEAIAQAYRKGGGYARFGLPASRPAKAGPYVIQRFQRYVFQHWVESVPGMPSRGSVVGALVGDYLKDAKLAPPEAFEKASLALPPIRVRIPRIALDWPTVLADSEDLPRFKGVGWFIDSGYPGLRGNVVLLGHNSGAFETFGRLGELRPGDEVQIATAELVHYYVVTDFRLVTTRAVEVLAPSTDRRLTLITCAGSFEPWTGDYSHRLVVTATLTE